jgi:hypothetical protein
MPVIGASDSFLVADASKRIANIDRFSAAMLDHNLD